jgi:hypothetical protein
MAELQTRAKVRTNPRLCLGSLLAFGAMFGDGTPKAFSFPKNIELF